MTEKEAAPAGWSVRGLTGLSFAVLCGFFAFSFLYADRGAAGEADGVWSFVSSTILGHAAGGFVVGAVSAGLFGRRSPLGWGLALLGGVVTMLAAGALGGLVASLPGLLSEVSLSSEVIRVAAAIFVTPLAIAQAPWLAGLWLVAIAALHLTVKQLRAAR